MIRIVLTNSTRRKTLDVQERPFEEMIPLMVAYLKKWPGYRVTEYTKKPVRV